MSLDTKEDIKNRMLRKAAELWGVPANEIKESADPLIHLLLSACASEIEQLSGEISESQDQITERLIQLLTPDTVFDTKPAHAIAYADCLAPKVKMDASYSLYAKKEIEDTQAVENIHFSPTQLTNLVAAKIKYMILGNKAYEFLDRKSKDIVQIFNEKESVKPSTLYLAIESDLDEIPLDQMAVYFEYLGVEEKELFYYHLKNAVWSTADHTIETIQGFQQVQAKNEVNLDVVFGGTPTKTSTLINEINAYYNKFYITLQSKDIPLEASSFPEIESLLAKEKIELPSDLRWLKIEFPTVVRNSMLSRLFCTFNTFPVVNRKKEHFAYQVKKMFSIIPIISEALFLDIKSIRNTEGDTYKLQHTNAEFSEKGTYVLRSKNVAPIDSQNAKDYLVRLIELLKSESAAFSFMEQDFLSENVETLNQTISKIEQKLSEVSIQNKHTNYISIKPYKEAENILVEYWTSSGVFANTIKTGTQLQIYEGYDINPNTTYLVTPTFGGQNKLSREQCLNAYRSSTLSHGRIITKQDIIALCHDLYQDKIETVEVRKGTLKDYSFSKGLVQCMEIILIPSENNPVEDYEWDYLNDNLMTILGEQSMNIYPFKITLRTQAITNNYNTNLLSV